MFSLVYVSRSTENFNPRHLLEMLLVFRAENLRLNLTGLLLYKNGNFMQLLEGEQTVVLELYGKIRHDPRHTNVITLIDELPKSRSDHGGRGSRLFPFPRNVAMR
jgi:hypothetical protein